MCAGVGLKKLFWNQQVPYDQADDVCGSKLSTHIRAQNVSPDYKNILYKHSTSNYDLLIKKQVC